MTHGHDHPHRSATTRRPPHKDWRVIAVVVLMLGAMAIYVLTNDESLPLNGAEQPALGDVDAE